MSDLDDIRAIADEDATKKALRKTLKALDKEKRRTAELVAAVYDAARDAAEGIQVPHVVPPKRDKRRTKPETAIMLLADWQLGKVTPEYNSDVTFKRLDAYIEKALEIISYVRAHHPVNECRMYLLGDLVEGEMIFPGQAHRIDSSAYRQVFDGAEKLVEMVQRVRAEVPDVKVRGVIGNHGEVGGRARREMHPETNFDAFLMNTARLLLRKDVPNLDFPEPFVPGERAWYVRDEVMGRAWMLAHGNQVKGASFGIPWYGFQKKAQGWFVQMVQNGLENGVFHYLATGHWHQTVREDINGIIHFGAGSTESANTYAQEFLAGGGQQGSQWLIFQNEHGLTSEHPIRL